MNDSDTSGLFDRGPGLRSGLLALLAMLIAPQANADTLYAARVDRVIDGDSLAVTIDGWPDPVRRLELRLWGIDTPEIKTSKCSHEKRLGLIAKYWVRREVPAQSSIRFEWMHDSDKYGRLLVRVILPDGRDLAQALLASGMAVRYQGGKKTSWCDTQENAPAP